MMKKITHPGIFLIIAAVLISLSACGKNTQATWQEQYDLGVRYLSEGNYEEAIIAFTAAIEIDPKRPEAFIGRGDAYIGSGETDETLTAALADYEAAIALDETMPEAWLGLADVYIRQGNYDKALESLREALEKTGSDPDITDKLEEMEGGSFSDSAGHVRRMNSYDGEGNLIWYHTYTYDAEEREASATSFDSAGNQTGHVNIIYDENGKNLTDWGYIQDNGVLFKIINKYDQSGRLTQIDHYFNGEEVSSYVTFEYDEKGNTIREVQRDADGSMEEISTFNYDDAGYLIRRDWYDWYSYNGALRYYYLYEWNSEGRLVQISCHNADGTLESRTVKRYDDQGNHIGEDIYDGAGNLSQTTVKEN